MPGTHNTFQADWKQWVTIEAILIVLSVFLALGLISWRENRTNQELASQVDKYYNGKIDMNGFCTD